MSDFEFRMLSLGGFLGYGYPRESLWAGIEREPHAIGIDAGSSDPGPYYLGSGEQIAKGGQIKRDLKLGILAAKSANIPFIIGSAGTAGGTPHLESTFDIVEEIAKEEDCSLKVAVISAEMDKEEVKKAVREEKTKSLGQLPELSEATVDESVRIVGQMDEGPFNRALDSDPDVVLAGRSCDSAIYASIPIAKGYDPGLAFHMAKIIECGAQCAIPTGTNDCILGTLREDHFELEPINKKRKLTPSLVAAHMMYEQPDPNEFYLPKGRVDLRDVQFESLDEHRVKVKGSRWVPTNDPTIKLEGVRSVGYRTISIAGINDPVLIKHLEEVENKVKDKVIEMSILDKEEYSLNFIHYGETKNSIEAESLNNEFRLGVVLEAIAKDQESADALLALTRSTFLHQGFLERKATGGNLAFPFSPSDFQGGEVYEFNIYHLLQLEEPSEPFPVEIRTIEGEEK